MKTEGLIRWVRVALLCAVLVGEVAPEPACEQVPSVPLGGLRMFFGVGIIETSALY